MVKIDRKILPIIIVLFIFLSLKSGFAQSIKFNCTIYNAYSYEQTGIASYSLVLEPEKLSINEGEDLFIGVYIPGEGIITASRLHIYVDTKVNLSFRTGYKFYEDYKVWGWVIPDLRFFYCSYDGDVTISESQIRLDNYNMTPLAIKLETSGIPEGDHAIKGVFSYRDSEGKWHTSEDTKIFHVKTTAEKYWWLGVGVFGAIVTIIITLIDWRLKKRSREQLEKTIKEVFEKDIHLISKSVKNIKKDLEKIIELHNKK